LACRSLSIQRLYRKGAITEPIVPHQAGTETGNGNDKKNNKLQRLDYFSFFRGPQEERAELFFPSELLCDVVTEFKVPPKYVEHGRRGPLSLGSSVSSLVDRVLKKTTPWFPSWCDSVSEFRRRIHVPILIEREYNLSLVHQAAFHGYLPPISCVETTLDFNWSSFIDFTSKIDFVLPSGLPTFVHFNSPPTTELIMDIPSPLRKQQVVRDEADATERVALAHNGVFSNLFDNRHIGDEDEDLPATSESLDDGGFDDGDPKGSDDGDPNYFPLAGDEGSDDSFEHVLQSTTLAIYGDGDVHGDSSKESRKRSHSLNKKGRAVPVQKRTKAKAARSESTDPGGFLQGGLSRNDIEESTRQYLPMLLDMQQRAVATATDLVEKQMMGNNVSEKNIRTVADPCWKSNPVELSNLAVITDTKELHRTQLSIARDNFMKYTSFYVSVKTGVTTKNRECHCLHCFSYFHSKKKEMEEGGKRISKLWLNNNTPTILMNDKKTCTLHLRKCKHFCSFAKDPVLREILVALSPAAYLETKLAASRLPVAASRLPTTASPGVSTLSGHNYHGAVTVEPPSVVGPMNGHVFPKWTRAERKNFDDLMLEFVVDTAQSFTIVQQDSFARLLNAARPGTSDIMPGRTKLSVKLLKDHAKAANIDRDAIIKSRVLGGQRVGVAVDGMVMVSKVHVEAVAMTVGSKSYLIDTVEAGSINIGVYVASCWETELENIFTYLVKEVMKTETPHRIHYFVSDDAGQCGKARRILALRNPTVVFQKCMAHQVNLMVAFVIKGAGVQSILKMATNAVTKINASSSKFLPYLKDTCREMYGHKVAIALLPLADTRWNSCQACLASILRIKNALKVWSIQYQGVNGYSESFKVFQDEDFWRKVKLTEVLIRPLCQASFLMQRDANTMAEVIIMLLNMWKHIKDMEELVEEGHDEEQMGVGHDIQRRWRGLEHPLFFLAFAMHPLFAVQARLIVKYSETKNGNWASQGNVLSVARLCHAARCYYQKYRVHMGGKVDQATFFYEKAAVETASKKLGKDVKRWLMDLSAIDDSYDPKNDDPVEWWKLQQCEFPEMSNFAMFLLSCPVQSASCERIFKNYSAFHTKKRNHLDSQQTYKMTLVKYNLRNKYNKRKEKKGGTKRRKNKDVNATQHNRINRIMDEDESGDEQRGDKDEAGVTAGENYDINNEDNNSQDVENDGSDSDSGNGEGDETVVDAWCEAFEKTIEEAAEEENLLLDKEESDEDNGNPGDEDDTYEHLDQSAFESPAPQEKLDKWPDWDEWDGVENYEKWPQENAEYFKKAKRKWGKSYVRADKYDLDLMLACFQKEEHDEEESTNTDGGGDNAANALPSMESSYGADYG
jgi:hypothetical protein